MPNYVEMEYDSISRGTRVVERYNLNQNVQLELNTSVQDLREFFPSLVTKMLDFVKKMGQFAGVGNYYLESSMALPMWDKTDPLRINLELFFYTKTNPILDVLVPIYDLCSIALPIRTGDRYELPFVNVMNAMGGLKNLIGSSVDQAKDTFSNKKGKNNKSEVEKQKIARKTQAKLLDNVRAVSVMIPGVILMPGAFITKAIPIFSNEVTKSGAPLWGQVNLEVRSFVPAEANMLYDSLNFLKGTTEAVRQAKLGSGSDNAFY